MNALTGSAHFTLNGQPLADLKRAAKENTPESIRAVARQFESMLLNVMMKGMRAGSGDHAFSNESGKLFTEMLDQEYAQKIASGKGMGLADALVAQLSRPRVQSVDPETQSKSYMLRPEVKPGGYSQGLPGAAGTPIPLPAAPKTEGILLAPRAYQLQSMPDAGSTLRTSA